MDWLSDLWHWLLLSPAGWWAGFVLIWFGIVLIAAVLVPRYGGVTLGPDPTPRRTLSDATTVIFPASIAAPNYHRSELDDWYPMADTVDLTPQLQAVAAFFERTETITVTRGVVITIPEPRARHRIEDVHAETVDITAAVRRAREAKELTS